MIKILLVLKLVKIAPIGGFYWILTPEVFQDEVKILDFEEEVELKR